MKHSIERSLGIMLVGAALVAVPVASAVAQDSGFMKDYSKLKMVKDSKGVERRIWISEKLTRENYKAVHEDRHVLSERAAERAGIAQHPQ